MTSHDLKPGEHVVLLCSPAEVDSVGFAVRNSGLGVRDCFSVQVPSAAMMGLLVRAPFEETVAGQVVRHGAGALDIDASRISLDPQDPHMRPNAENHKRNTGGVDYVTAGGLFDKNYSADMGRHNSKGRFPANLLLVHGPDCRCVGTRKVKSGTAFQDNKTTVGGLYKGGWDENGLAGEAGYASKDGTEKVADWQCQPDCPVTLLDGQSGNLGNNYRGDTKANGHSSIWDSGKSDTSESQHDDTGGASRFFHQATTFDNLESYLRALTETQ